MSEKNERSWVSIAEKVWIPLVVVIIGAIVGPIIVNECQSPSTPTATPALPNTSFTYQVEVRDQNTGKAIEGAVVTITIGGDIAPVDDVTDAKGIAMISIDASRAGKTGRLIVTASGYDKYDKHVNLTEDALPNVVQLAHAP